jgi:hypothetical protein
VLPTVKQTALPSIALIAAVNSALIAP